MTTNENERPSRRLVLVRVTCMPFPAYVNTDIRALVAITKRLEKVPSSYFFGLSCYRSVGAMVRYVYGTFCATHEQLAANVTYTRIHRTYV